MLIEPLHSDVVPQGCTLAYMMLASNDNMNDKISVVLHMGPVAFPHWFRGHFLKQQALIRSDQVRHQGETKREHPNERVRIDTSCENLRRGSSCRRWGESLYSISMSKPLHTGCTM
jgi:hypothetical protein